MILLMMMGFNSRKSLFILFGSLIITAIFSNKLLSDKIPKDLSVDDIEKFLPFAVTGLSVSLMLLFFTLYQIYKRYMNKTTQGYFTGKFSMLSQYYTIALESIDVTLINSLPYSGNVQESICKLLTRFANKELIIIILFRFLPKLLMPLIFIVEIIYFHQIAFFYKLSPLLLLPLIINYIAYRIRNFIQDNLQSLENIIIITVTNKQETKILNALQYADYSMSCEESIIDTFISLNPLYKQSLLVKGGNPNKELKEIIHFLHLLLHTRSFVYYIKFYQLKYDRILNVIIYSSYIIGWVYLLI